MRRILLFVLGASITVSVVACEGALSGIVGSSPRRAADPSAHPPVASPSTSASGVPTRPENLRTDADDILSRARAASDVAVRAVTLDGREDTRRMAKEMSENCGGRRQRCFEILREAETNEKVRVGVRAGMALSLAGQVSPNHSPSLLAQEAQDVARAEAVAQQALDEAKKIVAARAEQEKRMEQQAQAVSEATTTCAASEGQCKLRCEKGEPFLCLALAVRLRTHRAENSTRRWR